MGQFRSHKPLACLLYKVYLDLFRMRSTVEKQSFEKEGHSDEEWQKMTTLLKQRDDEISIQNKSN